MTAEKKRLCFSKVDAVDADRIHLMDAIRAAVVPRIPGVSSTAAKLTLLMLLTHMNPDGELWEWDKLTMSELAHKVGVERRHMRRIRAGLEEVGVLVTEQRNWTTNKFALQVDPILEWGRHGKGVMDAERARRRSDSVRVKRDAPYHQEANGQVAVDHDLAVVAGAIPDSYEQEAWREHNPGRIFCDAFKEWPQLAVTKRAARKRFNDRTGEDRSIAAWYRDCTLVADFLRTDAPLAQWALAGAKLPEGQRALRITSAAGWGQLLHAARRGTLLEEPGVDPAAPSADDLAGIDLGSPTPLAIAGRPVDLWSQVREAIIAQVEDPRIDEVWLDKGRAERIVDGRLVVAMPNRLYVEHVVSGLNIDWEAVDIPIRLTSTG